MKNLFLALLAMVAFVACNNTESDYNYEFEFENGMFVSGAVEPITYEQFCEEVAGYCWERVASNEIKSNGTLGSDNYWGEMEGGAPGIFNIEPTLLTYYSTFVGADVMGKGYMNFPIRYDSNSIYIDDDNVYEYYILKIDGNQMTCIENAGLSSLGYHFVLSKFRRMSNDELSALKRDYTIDFSR